MCILHDKIEDCMKAEHIINAHKCENCGDKQSYSVTDGVHYITCYCNKCGFSWRLMKIGVNS